MGMIPNSMAWHATIWADAQPKFVQLPLEVKLQFVRDPKIYFYGFYTIGSVSTFLNAGSDHEFSLSLSLLQV